MAFSFSWKRKLIICLPIFSVGVSIITIIVAYITAVHYDNLDENHFVPFISDIGDYKPHSSFFSFGLTISGSLTFVVIFLRYMQVKVFYTNCHKINSASIVFGIIFVFGRIMVVTFQLSSQRIIHYLGALLYCAGVLMYCSLQALISYRNKCKNLYHIRATLAILMLITGSVFALFIIPPFKRINHQYNLSQISEWGFAACKMVLLLTFVYDFKERTPYLGLVYTYREGYENIELGHDYYRVKVNNKGTQC